MITGKNYIGNQRVAAGSKTFQTFNPVTNTPNDWLFKEATAGEVNEALYLASKAFETYKLVSGPKKADFLNQIADEIEALGEILITTYCQETGLPEGRAKGERGRTMGQLRSFASLVEEGSWLKATIDTAEPDRQPIPKPDLRKMMMPLGPVVVFGASNFPLAYSTAGGDTASALAAGCPVVVKSHPMHAGTGELVAMAITKAAEKTAMPKGVFANLNSSGIEVGVSLVKHPLAKAVGFTGSIKGGRALFDLASKREEPIPVFAEMGSVNPVVILPKALKSKAREWAQTYAGSITLGTGQFCTKPGLLFAIKGQDLDNFTDELGTKILDIESSIMLHPNIHKAFNENKQKQLMHQATNEVASYQKDVSPNFAKQAVLQVSGEHFIANQELQEEVFGPFSMVVACNDLAELEAALLKVRGQLTGTVIAENSELVNYERLVQIMQTKVGRLIFNGVPTGVEVCAAMQHGGPYPASTDSRFSAVGIHAIDRWVRPISYQNWPDAMLPEELKNENPLSIHRKVNGKRTVAKI